MVGKVSEKNNTKQHKRRSREEKMEFHVTTEYRKEAFTAMSRVLRKTIRKKHSRRTHIFGAAVILLAMFLAIFGNGKGAAVTWAAAVLILLVLLFEDRLNGYVARKRILKGTERSDTTFFPENYVSRTAIGVTEFSYAAIAILAETERYFVFVFDNSHGQAYDKKTLSGGSPEEFRAFLMEKTGKEIQRV